MKKLILFLLFCLGIVASYAQRGPHRHQYRHYRYRPLVRLMAPRLFVVPPAVHLYVTPRRSYEYEKGYRDGQKDRRRDEDFEYKRRYYDDDEY